MKKLSLDAFTLKIIAIVSMGVHHTLMVFWEYFPVVLHIPLYALRGITFPIMAFFVTEGFRRTSSTKKYMLRLFVFGLISQVPYSLVSGLKELNIVFTILLGLIVIVLFDKLSSTKLNRALFIVIFVVILAASFGYLEGGPFGPLMIFLFHVIKDEKKRRTYPLICWGVMMILLNLLNRRILALDALDALDVVALDFVSGPAMQLEILMSQYYVVSVGSFLIIPLLRAYNGNRGRKAKYLFYAFYPGHWVVLGCIAYALGSASI